MGYALIIHVLSFVNMSSSLPSKHQRYVYNMSYIYTVFTIYTPVASFSKSLMHPLILIRDKPGAGDKGGVGGLRGVLALDPRQPGNQTNTANPPCPNTSVLSKENHQESSVLLYPVILKAKS